MAGFVGVVAGGFARGKLKYANRECFESAWGFSVDRGLRFDNGAQAVEPKFAPGITAG